MPHKSRVTRQPDRPRLHFGSTDDKWQSETGVYYDHETATYYAILHYPSGRREVVWRLTVEELMDRVGSDNAGVIYYVRPRYQESYRVMRMLDHMVERKKR